MSSNEDIEISSRILKDLRKLLENSGDDSLKLNEIIGKLKTVESGDADETIDLVRQYIGHVGDERNLFGEILSAFEKVQSIHSVKVKLSIEIEEKLDELF